MLPDLDVIIYLPTDQVLTRWVEVRGGRNVRIAGRDRDAIAPTTCCSSGRPNLAFS
jgi:hypothetical protein